MKKILFLIFAVVFPAFHIIGDTFTRTQSAMRTQMIKFLNEEGYSTEIDSDGDIKFKSEDFVYVVNIDTRDELPMYCALQVTFVYGDIVKAYMMPDIAAEINKYIAIKLTYDDETYLLDYQTYLVDIDQFRYTFFKAFDLIESATSKILELAEEYNTGASAASRPSTTARHSLSLSDLFPVNGYSLNMTLGQLKAIGAGIKDMYGTKTTDHYNPLLDKNGDDIFETMYINYMPNEWKKKFGMEMSMSYNQWTAFFAKYGFTITKNNVKINTDKNGLKYLYGPLSARNSEGITFMVYFDKNDRGSGGTKSAKNTVDFISIKATN